MVNPDSSVTFIVLLADEQQEEGALRPHGPFQDEVEAANTFNTFIRHLVMAHALGGASGQVMLLKRIGDRDISIAEFILAEEQHCRFCGCTDGNACPDFTTGLPCFWLTPDVCSACRHRLVPDTRSPSPDTCPEASHV